MKLKTRILTLIFKNHKTNKIYDRQEYPQSWWIVSKYPRWLRRSIKWFCGKIGGHEPSSTEWAYGGGEYAHSWCRWCDKMIQVPKTSIYFKHRGAKDLMSLINKEEK